MSEVINISVAAGKSIKLLTSGKFCDKDIVVTAEGGGSGGGTGLTPSEGLEFAWDEGDFGYGVKSLGTCTDSEIVIPNKTPEGYPVSCFTWDFVGVNGDVVTRLVFPDSMRIVKDYFIGHAPNVKYIKFGKYTSNIYNLSGSGMLSPNLVLDFSDFEGASVPTLTSTQAVDLASQILVPEIMADTWRQQTNWSAGASKIVGV